jgi:hypothetical protein
MPPGIRQALRLCLETDARKRRRSAADVRIDLELAMASSEKTSIAAPAVQAKSRVPWLITGVFAIAAAAIGWTHFRERAPAVGAPVQFDLRTRIGGGRNYASVSPDGRWLAYYDLDSDDRPSLFLRDLVSMEPHAVPGSGEVSNIGTPIWSTDSRYVGFTGATGLMKVEAEGGAPLKVIEALYAFFGSWNRDGVLIRGVQDGVMRAAANEPQMTVLPAAGRIEGDTSYLTSRAIRHILRRSSLPTAGAISSAGPATIRNVTAFSRRRWILMNPPGGSRMEPSP